MAVSIVEAKIAGGGAAAASLSVNFDAQPASGKPWLVSAACYFPDSTGQIAIDLPASLIPTQDLDAGGNLAALLSRKLSSGSDGTTSRITKSGDNETLAISAMTLDGVDAYDTSGKNADGPAATSLAIATDGNVSADGSWAVATIYCQSGTYTHSMSGWTFLDEVVTTTANRTNVHRYLKTVDSGAPAGGTFTVNVGRRIKGFITVYTAIAGPPVASIDSPPGDVEIYAGDSVVLEGSATEGSTPYKNWLWKILEGGSGVNNQTSQNPGAVAFPNEGTWTLRLTVDGDDDQTSDPVDRTITVLADSNIAPVAEAGPLQVVTLGDEVTLDGTGSSDADDDPLTYDWSIVSEPVGSSISLSSETASQPTFTPTHIGNYVFNLVVNDGTENSPSDEVTIVVRPESVEIDDVPSFDFNIGGLWL